MGAVFQPASAGSSQTNLSSITDAITAHAGGGQASAVQLTAAFNRISTVATAADSVKLYATPRAGIWQVVINNASNALAVYPQTGGSIANLSANAKFTVFTGEVVLFWCQDGTNWQALVGIEGTSGDGLGRFKRAMTLNGNVTVQGTLTFSSTGGTVTLNTATGQNVFAMADNLADALSFKEGSNVYLRFITTNGSELITFGALTSNTATNSITAFAGGGQASATALTTAFNRVATCATVNDSVKLPTPPASGSVTVVVRNDGAATLAVFPASGGQINALGANTADTITSGAAKTYLSISATQWFTT